MIILGGVRTGGASEGSGIYGILVVAYAVGHGMGCR